MMRPMALFLILGSIFATQGYIQSTPLCYSIAFCFLAVERMVVEWQNWCNEGPSTLDTLGDKSPLDSPALLKGIILLAVIGGALMATPFSYRVAIAILFLFYANTYLPVVIASWKKDGEGPMQAKSLAVAIGGALVIMSLILENLQWHGYINGSATADKAIVYALLVLYIDALLRNGSWEPVHSTRRKFRPF